MDPDAREPADLSPSWTGEEQDFGDEPGRFDGRRTDRDDLFGNLIRLVGGYDALEGLDAEPIPDEPFDWSAVEPSDRPMVTRVLELSDRCCDELLDPEYRTIARRVLALVAARDPRVLRRSTNAERCAAALVWLVGRASGQFGRRGRPTSGRVWDWFGVTSCADRGQSLRNAAGLVPKDGWMSFWGESVPLGDVALLHSDFRAGLISRRDALAEIERRRRPWSILDDGRTAHLRVAPVRVVAAAKGIVAGGHRTVVTIALGDDLDHAEFFALSIPEAHELVRMVQRALHDPPPHRAAP